MIRGRRLLDGLTASGLLIVACVLRLPTLGMPLNRDEATYALIADRAGWDALPYRDLFDNKQPLIYAVYWAVQQVAPQSVGAVRLTAALCAGAAAVLLFALVARHAGAARGAAAAATALVAGASTYVEGYDLNTEHVLIATGTGTILLALVLSERRTTLAPLLVGLAAGLAVLTKAVFLPSVAAAAIPLLAGRRARGQSAAATLALLAAGTAALPLATFAAFAAAGAGADFWEGNVGWNRTYVAASDGHLGLSGRLAPVGLLAAAAAVLGAARVWLRRGRDVLDLTLLAWLVAAFVGAKVGGRDFPHYFAPVVPPAAALLWLPWPAREGARAGRPATVVPALLTLALLLPFARDVARGFGDGGRQVSARQYGAGFAELWGQQFAIGQLLRSRSEPADRLFVGGAEPGFNLYSGIAPPTGYLFLYDYPEVPSRWAAAVRRDVCERPPRFVVLPWGRALDPSCLDETAYRELLTRPVPGGLLRVLELAQPR